MQLTRNALAWGASLSLLSLLLTLGLGVYAIVHAPEDRLLRAPNQADVGRPRLVRWGLRVGRNLAGLLLIALGLVLSLPGVPGQGLLTVVLGLLLTELPGRERLLRRLLRLATVRGGIDALRAYFGRPPLQMPPGLERELTPPRTPRVP